jgi:hypothetical protein
MNDLLSPEIRRYYQEAKIIMKPLQELFIVLAGADLIYMMTQINQHFPDAAMVAIVVLRAFILLFLLAIAIPGVAWSFAKYLTGSTKRRLGDLRRDQLEHIEEFARVGAKFYWRTADKIILLACQELRAKQQ